jgi:solute:Na+ symporter, SSS family
MPYVTQGLPLYWWPLLFLLSLTGCIIGTYLAPPTEEAVLISLYKTVRPWGFWQPIHQKVVAQDPNFVGNKNFALDMFNVAVGIVGQLCFTLLPMYFILNKQIPLYITIGLIVAIVLILKKTWWNKLEN